MIAYFINRIKRKLMKLRLQPIRVFCFHQVSEEFDPSTMWECDWMQTEQFKHNIMKLKGEYTFISLSEAYKKLQHDVFRRKKYAVLTADDGWASLLNIIPWLAEQDVSITLFLNPAYIIGAENREIGENLTQGELVQLLKLGKGLITIASHGWNHQLCIDMSDADFEDSVMKSEAFLAQYDEYVPFFAYPCGRYSGCQDRILQTLHIIPVYMDGIKNYNNLSGIHRELLE